ncbi:MAG: DUF971 domain-containing protein [Pirellula sp.]|jgi:DUF971 family protein
MDIHPVGLEKTDSRCLRITWSDGQIQDIPFGKLRGACPCATCKEKKKGEAARPKSSLSILSAAEAVPLDIAQMRPVGNYAYNVAFSDGHSSGLFTIELLRGLGQAAAAAAADSAIPGPSVRSDT